MWDTSRNHEWEHMRTVAEKITDYTWELFFVDFEPTIRWQICLIGPRLVVVSSVLCHVPSVPVEPEVFQAAMMRKKLPEKMLGNCWFHYQKWWRFTKQSRFFRDYCPQCIDFNIKWCLPLNIGIFSETALEPEIFADRTCSEQQMWWLCQESTGTTECQSATAK